MRSTQQSSSFLFIAVYPCLSLSLLAGIVFIFFQNKQIAQNFEKNSIDWISGLAIAVGVFQDQGELSNIQTLVDLREDLESLTIFDKQGDILFHSGERSKFNTPLVLVEPQDRVLSILQDDQLILKKLLHLPQKQADLAPFPWLLQVSFQMPNPWSPTDPLLESSLIQGALVALMLFVSSMLGAVVLIRRITYLEHLSHKKNDEELVEARKDAIAVSQLKTTFLANMSHELRTPLNGIIGFTNLLLRDNLSNRQADYLNTIKKSAQGLLSIVNDVLDFSKIEAGKMVLEQMEFNLREVIEEPLTLLAPSAQEKQIELVCLIYGDLPDFLLGDPRRIKQVITNLVGNAIKFSSTGDIVIRALLEQETDDELTVCIKVTDQGIGLNDDNAEKVFSAFNQMDSSTTRKFGGTGLGLPISKSLVEKMGGSIGVDINTENGVTFWFTFCSRAGPSNKIKPLSIALPPINFWLYETNAVTRLSIKHLLKHWHCDVKEVSDLSYLSEQLSSDSKQSPNKHSPTGINDLILLGLSEQSCQSEQVQQHIQFLSRCNTCCVVVLANTRDPLKYDLCLENGAEFCLEKPIQAHKLLNALTQLLNRQAFSPAKSAPVAPPALAKSPEAGVSDFNEKQIAKGLDILIVDDNKTNLRLLEINLESLGANINSCLSGQAAIDQTRVQQFDLILMDIQMPIMDGKAATKIIRSKEAAGRRVPIVAVTAHLLKHELEQLKAAGFDDFMTKPLNSEDLIRLLEQWAKVGQGPEQPRLNTPPPTPTHPSVDNTLSIDWNRCLKLVGGKPALALEMLNMVLESFQASHQSIKQAASAKDYPLLQDLVHKFHGGISICSLPALKATLNSFETALKQQLFEQVAKYMDELEVHIAKVKKEAQNYA